MDKIGFAAEFVDEMPKQAARELERHRDNDVSQFVDGIPDVLSSKALLHLLPHHAARCLRALPVDSSVRYLSALPVHNIANILRYLPQPLQQDIASRLPNSVSFRVGLLLKFPKSAVGSWADTSAIALPQDCTIAEALRRVRDETGDTPSQVFVVDDDRHLAGRVWIGALATEPAGKSLQQVLEPVTDVMVATTPVQVAIDDDGWKRSDSLPVVDRSNLFMGVLRYRDLRDAVAATLAAGANAQAHGGMFGLAGAWYSGLATILDAALAETPDKEADR